MLEVAIRRKIEDLVRRAPNLVDNARQSTRTLSECEGWITEAVNVIELAIPIENNSYRRRIKEMETRKPIGAPQRVGYMAASLRALLPDIDAGLIADFGNKVRAETFDDFLDHADAYLQEGDKPVAGVLAGVVFEDTIRRICRDKNITGDSLVTLIHALARQQVITPQQSKQTEVAVHVRTKATHALWDEYDLDGVAATIQLTRTFLREHLGG
jgi:hypothetical protein